MTLSMPTVEDCFLPLLRVLAAHGEPMVEQAAIQAAKQEGFTALPSIFHIQTDKRGVPVLPREHLLGGRPVRESGAAATRSTASRRHNLRLLRTANRLRS